MASPALFRGLLQGGVEFPLESVDIPQQLGGLACELPELGEGVADLALVVRRSLQAFGGWLIRNLIDGLAQDGIQYPHRIPPLDSRSGFPSAVLTG
jgi:hypothetical protein